MPKNTEFLKLFKWDLENPNDLESDFDIKKSLNDNWDKIDKGTRDLSDNSENKHTYYTMTVTEEKAAETEVEIPCSYTVGADNIDIFIDGIYLKCEKSEGDMANYREVGQAGSTSNKIQFGFNLEIGEELTFIVKGAIEDEQN